MLSIETLLEFRESKLRELKTFAATLDGRKKLIERRRELEGMVRQDEGIPDNPLSAQLSSLSGETHAWEYAVIADLLVGDPL